MIAQFGPHAWEEPSRPIGISEISAAKVDLALVALGIDHEDTRGRYGEVVDIDSDASEQ
jgi:hypothetical protein